MYLLYAQKPTTSAPAKKITLPVGKFFTPAEPESSVPPTLTEPLTPAPFGNSIFSSALSKTT